MSDVHPFFICTPARAGGTLFMDLLNSSGKLQKVTVYLSGAGELETDEDILSYWENIPVDFGRKWGTKVYVENLHIVERYLFLKKISPSSVKWIWLRRRDKINQAISHYRALRTNVWHIRKGSNQEDKNTANSDIEIPIEELNQFILFYFFVDSAWENFFRINEIKPYTIFYEDFIDKSDWKPTIKGVLDFLEVPSQSDFNVDTNLLKPTPDSTPIIYERFLDYNHNVLSILGCKRHFWANMPKFVNFIPTVERQG